MLNLCTMPGWSAFTIVTASSVSLLLGSHWVVLADSPALFKYSVATARSAPEHEPAPRNAEKNATLAMPGPALPDLAIIEYVERAATELGVKLRDTSSSRRPASPNEPQGLELTLHFEAEYEPAARWIAQMLRQHDGTAIRSLRLLRDASRGILDGRVVVAFHGQLHDAADGSPAESADPQRAGTTR